MTDTNDTSPSSGSKLGWRRALVATAVAGVLVGAVTLRHARASDHQDSPLVELNPSLDMTDFYAFPSATAGRMVLVLNSWAFLTPAEVPSVGFDPNVLYQFKIDNTGDAKEDLVIQVQFTGTFPNQTVKVWGPVAPTVVGSMRNKVATGNPTLTGAVNQVLGSSGAMQVFAGAREEPFFIDLEQFFRIVPDRKPVTGVLSQLPSTATAGSFRAAGAAVDFTKGFNVLSIIIELPVASVNPSSAAKIGLWGTISR